MPRAPRAPHFAISRKVLIGFGIALAMVVIIGVISYRSTRAFLSTAESVELTRRTLEVEESFLRALLEAESSARGYAVTGNEEHVRKYEAARVSADERLTDLCRLLVENPAQLATARSIKPDLGAKLQFLDKGVELRKAGDVAAVTEHFGQNEDIKSMDRISAALAGIASEESRLLKNRAEANARLGNATSAVLVGGSVLTFLLLLMAAVLILKDIAARRRVEEKLDEERNLLQSVMDAMPDVVHVKDRQGRYIIDNRAHREFLGVRDFSDVEGKSVYDFFPADLAEPYALEDEQVMKTGQLIRHREESVCDGEGNARWFSVNKVPLKDRDGDIVGIVVVTSDITERKEAEEILRLTAAQLERSNRELQDFASVASHDLQEPLRKILAFSDRLQIKCGAALGDNGRDYLERVMTAARRMQTLIQDLLTLARVTSRAQPFVPVDLDDIVRGVVSDLEIRIEQSAGHVDVSDLPILDADPLQMRQLFLNLINNALKFAQKDVPPRVYVRASIKEAEDGVLPGTPAGECLCEIRVEDNGIGFDERFADRIFQVFQRLHGRNEYEGTGIGLAVVRKILDRHGGQIVARSIEGTGSTFIVTLPIKQRMRETNEEAR